MVGISRQSGDFSAYLFKELCRRGYDVVPVNPNASSLLGRPCFARVPDIEPPVGGVLLLTDHPTARRIKLGDTRSQELFDLSDLRRFQSFPAGTWGGLAPDDSRLYVQDLSVQEIYSLQRQLP